MTLDTMGHQENCKDASNPAAHLKHKYLAVNVQNLGKREVKAKGSRIEFDLEIFMSMLTREWQIDSHQVMWRPLQC